MTPSVVVVVALPVAVAGTAVEIADHHRCQMVVENLEQRGEDKATRGGCGGLGWAWYRWDGVRMGRLKVDVGLGRDGEGQAPHFNLKGPYKVTADAGAAAALGETTKEDSLNSAHIGDDVDKMAV